MSFFDDLLSMGQSKPKSNEVTVECFTYNKMLRYYCKVSEKLPGVTGCQINIFKESEYRKVIRPQERWVITQVFCDAAGKPLMNPANGQDGYGRIVTADSFDQKFSQFMNGRKQAMFTPTAEELRRVKERKGRSLYEKILEKLAAAVDRAAVPEFTIRMLKSYRELPGSKVILAKANIVVRNISHDLDFHNFDLSLIDDDDYVVAEYDEKNDTIVKVDLINPEEKIRSLVEKNNGIVIIED